MYLPGADGRPSHASSVCLRARKMMTLTESNQTGWRGGDGGQLLWQSFSSALFAQWVEWVAMGGFSYDTREDKF